MDEIDLSLSKLTGIRGLGKGKLRSIVNKIGGNEQFLEALDAGDVGLLSSVDGVSQRMAVEIILVHRSIDPGSLLRTEAAGQIYSSVMEIL